MENNKNKKSVKFQGDMLNFCDFIQVFVFTRNHHLKITHFSIFWINSSLLYIFDNTVSSLEHEVFMVSYCDQSMSTVRRASSVVDNLL